MTDLSNPERLERFQRAAEIMADYEQQHEFKLSEPWRNAVPQLLRQGLTDVMLHDIFDALVWTEVESGRREKPADKPLDLSD